ncbi:MAG: hypothetical protein ACTHKZ_04190 [Lysobacteraceae bacterium]
MKALSDDATAINISVDITWNGTQPTYTFSGDNVSTDGTIDLSTVDDAADIRFSLVSEGGEMFDSHEAIAITPARNPNDCPRRGSGHAAPVFSHPNVDGARRVLSMTDHNGGGSQSGNFKYALFMTDRNNQPIPPCDPMIINR